MNKQINGFLDEARIEIKYETLGSNLTNEMDVAYFRSQDYTLNPMPNQRSLDPCKQCLMQVLQESRLRLSGKKTRIGSIDKSFHFLGIQYPKTQPLDNTQ
ncbi:hypothetical protein [Legionella hackeliae]|nr:hypothetical protein [Legionella hackeliae]